MPEEFIDEMTPIAKYMASEMTRNPRSPVALRILALNTSGEKCASDMYQAAARSWQASPDPTYCVSKSVVNQLQAMKLWYDQVRYDGPWDHKPEIKRRPEFHSRTGSPEFHIFGNTAYNFDVWSNVHYGYVGLAVGFDRSLLLDGAGVAQLTHDLKQTPPWPNRSGPWILPRSWDRSEDRIAIKLGFELYGRIPTQMLAEVLVREITKTKGLLTKPAGSEMGMMPAAENSR
jgi:hypothetical protein